MAIPYRDEVVPERQLRTLDQLVVELYEIILEILARLTLTSSPVAQNQTSKFQHLSNPSVHVSVYSILLSPLQLHVYLCDFLASKPVI